MGLVVPLGQYPAITTVFEVYVYGRYTPLRVLHLLQKAKRQVSQTNKTRAHIDEWATGGTTHRNPGGSSDDVEDRRDEGGGGMQFGGIHLGIGGIVIVFCPEPGVSP
jgi:hypothetical protein